MLKLAHNIFHRNLVSSSTEYNFHGRKIFIAWNCFLLTSEGKSLYDSESVCWSDFIGIILHFINYFIFIWGFKERIFKHINLKLKTLKFIFSIGATHFVLRHKVCVQ
jgi:hypothetical protein